jgi:hypothetical protein
MLHIDEAAKRSQRATKRGGIAINIAKLPELLKRSQY